MRETFFYLDCVLERAASSAKPPKGTMIVEGYASTSSLGSDNVVIAHSALKLAADHLLQRSTVLLNHDPGQAIGKVVRSEFRESIDDEGNSGIWVQIHLSKTRKDIYELIEDGTLNKFSIRGNIKDESVEFDATVGAEVVTVRDLELVEVSIVSVPADAKATITNFAVARSLQILSRALEDKTVPENNIETNATVDSPHEEKMRKLEETLANLQKSMNDLVEAERKRAEEEAAIREAMEREAEAEEASKTEISQSEETPEPEEMNVPDETTERAEGQPAKDGKCEDPKFPVLSDGKCFSSKEAVKTFQQNLQLEEMEESVRQAEQKLVALQEAVDKRSTDTNTQREAVEETDVSNEKLNELARKHEEALAKIAALEKKLEQPISRAVSTPETSSETPSNPFERAEYKEKDPHEKLDILARAIAGRGGITEALPVRE